MDHHPCCYSFFLRFAKPHNALQVNLEPLDLQLYCHLAYPECLQSVLQSLLYFRQKWILVATISSQDTKCFPLQQLLLVKLSNGISSLLNIAQEVYWYDLSGLLCENIEPWRIRGLYGERKQVLFLETVSGFLFCPEETVLLC
ncbi:hypothetical protein KC19_VG294500 [Ceratodon purpureus]|uniref:Uncharacterized protein n=1 Tax=Ceratodon purpureus TaxID=3225 RepID=A0A8T0HUW6_CERPU|nr:hypothetical protein KC19_VG294500 [Ceratodon purpureus]